MTREQARNEVNRKLKTREQEETWQENFFFEFEQSGQRSLQECWRSAQRWLASISAPMTSGMMGQRGLQKCWRSGQVCGKQ
jgi:hypothetical protein